MLQSNHGSDQSGSKLPHFVIEGLPIIYSYCLTCTENTKIANASTDNIHCTYRQFRYSPSLSTLSSWQNK